MVVCLFVCVEYMAYSTLYYVLCVQLLKLKCAVQTPCTTAQQRHILDTLQLGVSLHSLFDDIVKLLATLGLHFHTLLRPLCTFGLHLGSFLRSLGPLGPSFGFLFSILGAQGQLCGLFWHTRGPKVEITKKDTALDPKNLLFWRAFWELVHKNEGVCGRLFACRVLVVF